MTDESVNINPKNPAGKVSGPTPTRSQPRERSGAAQAPGPAPESEGRCRNLGGWGPWSGDGRDRTMGETITTLPVA